MRRLVFLALAAALAAIALLAGSQVPQHIVAPGLTSPSPPRRSDPPRSNTSGPSEAAHRFIGAFIGHQSDPRDRAARAAIRATAAPHLARELLASPLSSVPRAFGRPATTIRVTRLPHRPELALLTGTIHRASGPEQVAFLLTRRRGRWLALAPAE